MIQTLYRLPIKSNIEDSTRRRTDHPVFISVGSNIGNRLQNCKKGISALTALKQVKQVETSPFYQTEPVDYKDQDWFVNCAVRISTDLDPPALLKRLQGIQYDAGQREKTVRFGPRVLDLDIVLFDDWIVHSEELTIPHPRMHKRHFVLKPICDIDPNINHPVLRQSMQSLLDNLDEEGQRTTEYK